MNALGIGLDLVTISRFARLYGGDGEDALHGMFAASELIDAGDGVDKWERLAARYAAKEAVFKALKRMPEKAELRDVVVRSERSGAPFLEVGGATGAYAASLGVTFWLVSLSHTDDVAGAVVMACKER